MRNPGAGSGLNFFMLFSVLVVAALQSFSAYAEPDTLNAVTIVADRGVVVSKKDTVPISNAVSITDVLERIPGFYVSDNGGSAGLKTVNLRGLGSPHTAIYIDGVRVGNVQSGQGDLGMLDVENMGSAVIDYAQNSLSFTTARPSLGGNAVGGKLKFRAGSFGTYEPSGRLDFKLSDEIVMSATASGIWNKGNFPYGDGLLRENNDISQLRSGLDAWGLTNGGDWHVKAYYNGSDRGTPGSTSWPSTDRQKDRNAFVQGLLRKNCSHLYSLNLSAKASYDKMLYLSEWGDSDYGQTEFQLNSSHEFHISDCWNVSLAADVQWDGLKADSYEASRLGVVTALAAALRLGRFNADAALEYDGYYDRDGENRGNLSPSLDLRLTLFEGFDIVAFGRRAYRVPTFNELYYPGYGNPELQSEDAWLTDIGAEWSRKAGDSWELSAKLDGFYDYLKNKISSAPSPENPSIWMPYNVGVARMSGLDLQSEAAFSEGEWNARFSAKYSFQNAVDITPDSYSYGEQLPYIARHSVTLDASAGCKGWLLDALWNWRGGRRASAGEMPDWNTLNLSLGKDFALGRGTVLGLKAVAQNVFDCRYELSAGYPMPGRAFYLVTDFKF